MSEKNQPYEGLSADELILRDKLAIDRTVLAYERTLLAYIRTAVALLIAGASFIHFSQSAWFSFLGFVSAFLGFGFLFFGFYRFKQMKSLLSSYQKKPA